MKEKKGFAENTDEEGKANNTLLTFNKVLFAFHCLVCGSVQRFNCNTK